MHKNLWVYFFYNFRNPLVFEQLTPLLHSIIENDENNLGVIELSIIFHRKNLQTDFPTLM